MHRILLSLLVFFTNSNLIYAFDFDELKKTVESHSIKKLDDLLVHLPLTMRQNPVLVYDSHALNTQLVSLETPRIILFNEDASLILSLTKNPGEQSVREGLDELEFIRFDKNKSRFELGSIAFNGVDLPFSRQIEVNPKKCLSCHGNSPRPLFHDYNTWPGVFGSHGQRGVSGAETLEGKSFFRFLNSKKDLPRYRDLDLKAKCSESGLCEYPSNNLIGFPFETEKFTPNMAFGVYIERLMHDQMAKKLIQHKDFSKFDGIFFRFGTAYEQHSKYCKDSTWLMGDLLKKYKSLSSENDKLVEDVRQKISIQIYSDHLDIRKMQLKYNAEKAGDARGILNIPFVLLSPEYVLGSQFFYMETIWRQLGVKRSEVSTVMGQPTSGVFHLGRTNGDFADANYFRNLYPSLVQASQSFKNKFMAMSCEEMDAYVQDQVMNLKFIHDTKSILYNE